MFELQAAAKGLRFVYEPGGRLPQGVRADEKRLRQILINLLGNAVKFTREGGVALRVSYAREMATFEVCDTGPGMAAQELERVFEPFERGGHGGTGLGLTIARMLTDLMGGEMTVHSVPGEGKSFSVRLFLPELRDEVVVARPAMAPVAGYAGERRRVLVVDNEETDRELMARWLQPLGFEVRMATSGDDALRLLDGLQPGDAGAPHAILMDLAMPGIDGWETRRRLRGLGWAALPLAIVSANAFDKGLLQADPAHGQGLSAQDFLVKPVRREELLAWLAWRLDLQWLHEDGPAGVPASRPQAVPRPPVAGGEALPADADFGPLLELSRLGYMRGVVRWLDDWVRREPSQAAVAAQWRQLAREFRFEAIEQAVMRHVQA